MDPSGEVVLVQITVKAYKGHKIRTISELYKHIIKNRHSTKYIKKKWESEFKIKTTDEDWQNMWKMHQTSNSSRIWREFSWKNQQLKVKSQQLNRNIPCWRDCGALNADHSHVFWECDKITQFWKMIHITLLEVLGYV